MTRKTIEIQHESNNKMQDWWISLIEHVFEQRNEFYSLAINNIIDSFNDLQPRVEGCAGNTPKQFTIDKILNQFEVLGELTAMLYHLAFLNFRQFEITDVRHTLEVFLQYLNASEDHFRNQNYIDAKLRIVDARQYITRAFVSIDRLPKPETE